VPPARYSVEGAFKDRALPAPRQWVRRGAGSGCSSWSGSGT